MRISEKITMEKAEDITGRYWIFLNEKGEEIFSLCRKIDEEDKEGGYLYAEAVERGKKLFI